MIVPALFLGVIVAGFAAYLAYAAITWLRFGRSCAGASAHVDRLLDEFMPTYEIAERHSIRVHAPASITFSTAVNCDITQLAVVQTIIKAREIILGAEGADAPTPREFLAQMKALGWGVLADIPEREVVMGAVTKPWEANVVFRAVPPDKFRDFQEPGYVAIAWTLSAEPAGAYGSVARTETRVLATDLWSHAKFRRYWAFLSPGIILIRWAILRRVKREAERRFKSKNQTE